MNTRDLLFELRTEELPPRTLLRLSGALTTAVQEGIEAAGIAHGKVHGFATPRRLAVLVEKLAEQQPDRQAERRGPPLANAFDAHGMPTQAANAFAKSCGVAVHDLNEFKNDKGAWLQYRGLERGASTVTLLGAIVNSAIAALPIAKRMRWGARLHEFVRPVHGVVLLFGKDVVPIEVLGLTASRVTLGHRFHAPRAITLKSARGYAACLLRAKVVADFAMRREIIRTGVNAAAAASGSGARVLIDEALLEEVTALVEWPVPILGQFEQRFLRLPREVVIATIQDHQRYFAIEDQYGELSGAFVTVSNIESRDPSKVREGNERVVRPRLSDAAFFWDQDRKISLDAHAAKLRGMTFQTKLGSYADKTIRVRALAIAIGDCIGAGALVARASELAKADLMTAMVGEFPELQGTMGRYYALAEGELPELALALEEQYRPRFAADSLPATKTGQALSVAERIDTLVGIFAIELRPTGTKDPFGLRRAALGLLRIVLEGRLELDLFDLLRQSAAAQPVQRHQVVDEVYDFIFERLRGMLLEDAGTTTEMLDAVFAVRPSSPLDALARLSALKEFLLLPQAQILAATNKRIANILKKTHLESGAVVNPEAFSDAVEGRLHRAVLDLQEPLRSAIVEHRYAAGLRALVALRAPVDDFFEHTMVMDSSTQKRSNRLALLRDVQGLLGSIADLSRLPG